MTDAVRGADSKGSVEKTAQEADAVGPARGAVAGHVVVGSPDGRIAGMVAARHDSQHNDRDEETSHGQGERNAVEHGQELVSAADNGGAHPEDNLEDDERLPAVPFGARVAENVHGDSLVPKDRAHGGRRQQPGAGVEVSSEEANSAAILAPHDGRPVVDTAGRGDGRGQLGQRQRDEAIENRDDNEAVQHSHGPAIE